jgi:23S rRNA pseudouridine1911/1915/1917 synthase
LKNLDFGSLILYKNNQLLAVAKPAGISVQDDQTGDFALQNMAESFCKHPVQAVHRIDRPVSGIVLFAKIKSAQKELTRQLEAHTVDKIYLAVVQGEPAEKSAHLTHFLLKKKGENKVTAHLEEVAHSEKAELEYEVVGASDRYNLLKIKLLTGRHHQIRAQLAAIGCPIKGDAKYGARRSNPDRSIHLHAWKMAFDHPVSSARVELVAPLPTEDSIWNFFSETLAGNQEATF